MANKYVETPVYDEESFEAIQTLDDVPESVARAARGLPQNDASETITFARQLETISNRVFNKRYQELRGRSFVPFSAPYGLTASRLTYRIWDASTMAILVANFSTDFPLVSKSAREETVKFFQFGNSYGYNMLELRKAAAAGVPLTDGDAMMARKGHELAIDDCVATGVPELYVYGLVNHPNVPLGSMTNGSWATASGEEMLADMNDLVTTQWNTTAQIYPGDTMLFGTLPWRLINTKMVNSAGGTMTVLQAFRAQNPGITVDWWAKLDTAAADGTNSRVVFYKRDGECLEFNLGSEFEVFPADQQGLEVSFPCMSSMAGITFYHPLSALYCDDIGAL